MLILIGAAAGFVSGLTGAVGLIFNRFYLGYGLGKEQIIATRAANEIVLHIIKMVLYGLFGLLSPVAFGYGLLIGAAALLATWLVRPKTAPSAVCRGGLGWGCVDLRHGSNLSLGCFTPTPTLPYYT